VSVKMDKKSGTGELSCKVCGQQFQTGINYLSAAVDVYSDWIDACERVAKEAAGDAPGHGPSSSGQGISDRNAIIGDEDDDGLGGYDD